MKIYNTLKNTIYFGFSESKGYYSLKYKDISDDDTLKLKMNDIKNPGLNDISIDVHPTDCKMFKKFLNIDGNYNELFQLVKKYFDISEKDFDNSVDCCTHARILKQEIKRKYSNDYRYFIRWRKIYQSYINYSKIWGDDYDRIYKYVVMHDMEIERCHDIIVDIWRDENSHPTKIKLMRDCAKFRWLHGNETYELIDKVVEIYPDTKDFDKAFYYLKECIECK